MQFSTSSSCVIPDAWVAVPISAAAAPSARCGRSSRAPFASIASVLEEGLQQLQHLPWAQQKPPVGSIIEPKTGAAFEHEYCQRGSAQCGQLAGVGVRTKRIAGIKNINIYAVALYVDDKGVRRALHKYRGQPAEALAANQAFFDEVIKADTSKTLTMRISFSRIGSIQFWKAFQERLAPLMRAEGDAESMVAFGKTFDGINFRKGLPLSFCIHKDTLTSKVDGKVVGTVRSRALCESLQSIYLGSDPVAPDAKHSFAEGLSHMLSQ